jgi:surface carbohydrate biosynthesis protein
MALESKKGSIFYEIKGESKSNMEHLFRLKKKGICLIGQDEEAGISYSNFTDFRNFRPETDNIGKFDHFFCWGNDDLSYYKTHSQNSNLSATGSPRSIFWGNFGIKFYKNRTLKDERIIGKYILLITNLGVKNSLGNSRESKRYSRLSGYPDTYQKYMSQRKVWEDMAYKSVVQIVKAILARTTYNIVLRPHPAESISNWEREFRNEPRVLINKKDHSIPLILAASHVLHAGSTVGIESLLCNVSTISYSKLIPREIWEMVSDRFSTNPESISELVEALNSGEQHLAKLGFENVINSKITRHGDAEVLKSQASAISVTEPKLDLEFSKFDSQNSQAGKSLKFRLEQRIRFGKNQFQAIDEGKRPRIYLPTITDDLRRLSLQLDFEPKVDIIELGGSIFRLTVK